MESKYRGYGYHLEGKIYQRKMQVGAGIAARDGVLDNGGLKKAVIRASSGGAGAAQVPVHYPGNCTTSSRYTPGGGRG